MKAIVTTFHAPTATLIARVRAFDLDGNSITIRWDDGADWTTDAAHRKAADALCKKMNWTGKLVSGAVKGGFAFVFTS